MYILLSLIEYIQKKNHLDTMIKFFILNKVERE